MDLSVILAYVSAALAFGLAAAVAWTDRRSTAHSLFIAGFLLLVIERVFCALAADAVLPGDVARWELWRLLLLCLIPGTWFAFSQTYAREGGEESLRRNWWKLGIVFLLPLALYFGFGSELLVAIHKEEDSLQWVIVLGSPGFALHLLVLVGLLLILVNLERTFRASVGTMRWRIKFMILGLAVFFTARAYSSTQVLLFRAVEYSLQSLNSAALIVTCLLVMRSLSRAGHFEVRVYPSQTVLQHSITVLLAGAYLVIVGLFAKIVTLLGGDAAFEIKAFLVLASLVVLSVILLSEKVRLRMRRFVSRHFQRPLYDYRTVWRTFTEATARRVEQSDLCDVTVKLVSEIFQALSVTIWLVDDRKTNLAFAASTSLSEVKARELRLEAGDATMVLQALASNPAPIDVDKSHEVWAALLRRLHPDEFRKGGNRVCVPMIAGNELLGVLMLGDRVDAVHYTLQDFDLLKSVSDQVAASLLNIQLSQRLTQAKQLEAFQAMSAFFVHDLKNTASTMSLMLQNLPVHFNDPAFREDALRGIGKTVAHINNLISRLSALRQELVLRPVDADLNEIVSDCLKDLGEIPRVEIVRNLNPLPKILLDPIQIHTVVTNLILNAREAVNNSGRIIVSTEDVNGSVILTVHDNGCGMPAEFVERSLFKPFKTTKKKGIGIGMFQCKMIVEAHHGRIEVETAPGQGATFKVVLPARK